MKMTESLLKTMGRLNLRLPGEIVETIVRYDELLDGWNRKINLTRYQSADDRACWLYGESLWGAYHTRPEDSLIDLGSGSGFPGLAFKLLNPELRLTLIESRERKVHFLKEVIRGLHLTGVWVRNGRLEEILNDADWHGVNVSWRAVKLPGAILTKLAERLPEGGSLIHFGMPDSANMRILSGLTGYRSCFCARYPESRKHVLVQYRKGST